MKGTSFVYRLAKATGKGVPPEPPGHKVFPAETMGDTPTERGDMPGPAPNPAARRRNNQSQWRKLPAEGRQGEPPPWPLGTLRSKPVADRWAELWRTPQAIVWEELGWAHVVARYCRMALNAEKASAPVALMAEVRQLEDRLGLNPAAMRKLYWLIDTPATKTTDGDADVLKMDDYRELYG